MEQRRTTWPEVVAIGSTCTTVLGMYVGLPLQEILVYIAVAIIIDVVAHLSLLRLSRDSVAYWIVSAVFGIADKDTRSSADTITIEAGCAQSREAVVPRSIAIVVYAITQLGLGFQ